MKSILLLYRFRIAVLLLMSAVLGGELHWRGTRAAALTGACRFLSCGQYPRYCTGPNTALSRRPRSWGMCMVGIFFRRRGGGTMPVEVCLSCAHFGVANGDAKKQACVIRLFDDSSLLLRLTRHPRYNTRSIFERREKQESTSSMRSLATAWASWRSTTFERKGW